MLSRYINDNIIIVIVVVYYCKKKKENYIKEQKVLDVLLYVLENMYKRKEKYGLGDLGATGRRRKTKKWYVKSKKIGGVDY